MPDRRRHRGPHPEDRQDFAPRLWPRLRRAVEDLSWLLGRGYAMASALKLAGDRYQLRERQRIAVMRSACSDEGRRRRRQHRVDDAWAAGGLVVLDGYNVLTTVEAAMAGGLILKGRDDCFRDLAAQHGTWHRVDETFPAAERVGDFLAERGVAACRWLLDRPVSNSGRLVALLRSLAAERGWTWEVELVLDPDAVLKTSPDVIATSDSVVLDRAEHWWNLAREIVEAIVPAAWVVDLDPEASLEDSEAEHANHPSADPQGCDPDEAQASPEAEGRAT